MQNHLKRQENFKVIRSCLAKKYANAYKSGLYSSHCPYKTSISKYSEEVNIKRF
jgi:hypothetical protein